jgi:hypothetical protein
VVRAIRKRESCNENVESLGGFDGQSARYDGTVALGQAILFQCDDLVVSK